MTLSSESLEDIIGIFTAKQRYLLKSEEETILNGVFSKGVRKLSLKVSLITFTQQIDSNMLPLNVSSAMMSGRTNPQSCV